MSVFDFNRSPAAYWIPRQRTVTVMGWSAAAFFAAWIIAGLAHAAMITDAMFCAFAAAAAAAMSFYELRRSLRIDNFWEEWLG